MNGSVHRAASHYYIINRKQSHKNQDPESYMYTSPHGSHLNTPTKTYLASYFGSIAALALVTMVTWMKKLHIYNHQSV